MTEALRRDAEEKPSHGSEFKIILCQKNSKMTGYVVRD